MVTLGGLVIPNAETYEQLYPVRVRRQEMRADGGGAGQWRGGTGAEYEVELKSPAEYSFPRRRHGTSDRHRRRRWRRRQGSVHRRCRRHGRAAHAAAVCALATRPVSAHVSSPGGGGFGDPLDRDPAAVLRDVRDGVVTQREAEEVYGVVFATASLDSGTPVIDIEATRARQHEMRAARHAATVCPSP